MMMNGSRLLCKAQQFSPESNDQHCMHHLGATARKYQQLRCRKKSSIPLRKQYPIASTSLVPACLQYTKDASITACRRAIQ
jgi:hypothetical protein